MSSRFLACALGDDGICSLALFRKILISIKKLKCQIDTKALNIKRL